jgi:hypothetical protein
MATLRLITQAEFFKVLIPEVELRPILEDIYARRWLCAGCSGAIEVELKARLCACAVCGARQYCCKEAKAASGA